MTSPHVVDSVEDSLTLYGCLRRSDWDDQMRLGDKRDRVIPLKLDRTYVDLRTDFRSFIRERHKRAREDFKWESTLYKVEFTHLGFLYYSTQTRGIIPVLEKMDYPVQPCKDWSYFSVYHFNDPLPFQMHTAAGEELLNVTMMSWWCNILLEVVQLHESGYFDFSTFLNICTTSRDVKASATKSEAQGHHIQRRRAILARLEMSGELYLASELALQTVDFARWIPENPRCCSKLCRFGGKTGLWVHRDATRLHAGARRHIYEATTPQKRVADYIAPQRHKTNEYFVVCSQLCSQDVETAISISKRCKLLIIEDM